MADAGTISRIGGILKTVYDDGVKEQQNLVADFRNRIGKPEAGAWKAPGNHYEFSARVGGNRAGITPAASDDALPVPSGQKQVLCQVFERNYYGQIYLYVKDMMNTDKGSFQAFIDQKTNEMKGITRDFYKVANIDISSGDGSGVLSTVSAGATSTTQTLAIGTGKFQYGSLNLQVGDLIDFYDTTLTTSATGGNGVTVVSITPTVNGTTSTIVVSASLTSVTGGFVVRGKGKVNKSYVAPLAMLRNQGITFQGQSTSTNPLLAANIINANGAPLTESLLRGAMDTVYRSSGLEVDEFWAGLAQWAEYEASGFAQKRFMDMKLDKGFSTLTYDDKKIVKGVDIPSAVVMALNLDSIKFGSVTPWGPSQEDGSILKALPGFAQYYAYFVESGNFIYYQANANCLIDQLAYNALNPAYAK